MVTRVMRSGVGVGVGAGSRCVRVSGARVRPGVRGATGWSVGRSMRLRRHLVRTAANEGGAGKEKNISGINFASKIICETT